jgi:hypothetical protein
MRNEAALLFALLASACSVYDQTVGNGSNGGAAGDSSATSDATGPTSAGGAGGTDMGTSAGGAAGASTSGADTSGGGGAATSGDGGASGASDAAGSGGAAGRAGAAGAGVSAGGSSGKAGAGGGSGAGGSAAGSGGSTPQPDAGSVDAASDVNAGAVCAPGTCKRVFVSSAVPAPSGKLGGAAAVDTFCQSAADAKRLGGTWKAWISDTSSSPSTRFVKATVPYRLLDGSTIANNWTALASGTLQHSINIQEDGTPLPAAAVWEVWTATTPSGVYSGDACANWTNDTANPPTADVGVTSVTNAGWTDIYQQFCDRTTLHVYCFEQ